MHHLPVSQPRKSVILDGKNSSLRGSRGRTSGPSFALDQHGEADTVRAARAAWAPKPGSHLRPCRRAGWAVAKQCLYWIPKLHANPTWGKEGEVTAVLMKQSFLPSHTFSSKMAGGPKIAFRGRSTGE